MTIDIGLLSLSQIADDPRVRRQGDAFSAAGWNVMAVGVAGASSEAPDWPIDDATPALNWVETSRVRLRQVRSKSDSHLARILHRLSADLRYVSDLQAARVSIAAARRAYWEQNFRYQALYQAASCYRPRIWLVNDWNVLPIGEQLARDQGAILVYDTHELAADEYSEKRIWRILYRPLVLALERQGIRTAALTTCVSEGIAECLMRQYDLQDLPLVVRNTPSYQAMPFRPTGESIEVLYHGVVSPGRGLEESIRSLPLWRPEFHFVIRGPASASYQDELVRLATSLGVRERVSFSPPVPMVDLVSEANRADVGLFALPAWSRHNRFALPNKFFEYTMAGLALCVSDLPEMARLAKAYELGRLIDQVSAEAIATQINALDRGLINGYKRRALAAARQLSWEEECKKLVAHCAALVTGRS